MAEETNDNQVTDNEQHEYQLPDWAREQISKANNQAAKYRTEKNEAVEAAKDEVTKSFESKIEDLESKIAEAESEGATSRHEVDRLKVTIEAGIDSEKALDFADLLKGDNKDDLRSHAEDLKKLFSNEEPAPKKQDATDPSQGNHGTPKPLNGDPLLNAVTRMVNTR